MRRKATYLLAITQHQEPASAGFFLLKIIQSRMTACGRSETVRIWLRTSPSASKADEITRNKKGSFVPEAVA